jgi:hypothetical protein
MSKNHNLDFACIGSQKAGTTTLHDLLKEHPEIILPNEKEANFFDVNELYAKGKDWFYKEFFNDKTLNTEKKVGIINPNLSMETKYLDRLIEDNPNIKVIYIIRNPLERAYSHYKMSKRRGIETLSFEDALEKEEYRLSSPAIHKNYYSKEPGHFEKNHFSYLHRSNYSIVINYLQEKLPNERILLLYFEQDLIKDPERMLQKVCSFLKIKNISLNTSIKSNEASTPRFKVVRDFLFGSSKIKEGFKMVVKSPKFRRKFKSTLIDFNSIKDSKKEHLSPSVKQEVFEKYFKKIISDLELHPELNLPNWKGVSSGRISKNN